MPELVITGARGQLGADLLRAFAGHDAVALDRDALDVRDGAAAERRIAELRPAVVLNTAAYNHVDRAEEEPEEAYRVNALGPRALARATAAAGALLVHFSTNYVFEGGGRRPYREDDPPWPGSAYAVSKLAGECFVRAHSPLHLVIRTAGLYGLHGRGGKGGNFVETILRIAHERSELEVVEDQRLTPTYTADLAAKVVEMIDRWLDTRSPDLLGVHHVTNAGEATWCGFAREILRQSGSEATVRGISTEERPSAARRPAYAVLAGERLRRAGLAPLRPWEDALADYLFSRRSGT
ncbi:MAG: dTDP-4-dehydrorhamnose reductase [Candidatus Binatota bacterium]|nr:dTDP-4-dehydrorhamnose reductase [Candidatus Binatota bacterium]